MKFQIGYETINSYRRLAYTPWHALAEFIDNSTQAYFDNREQLDVALIEDGADFEVSVLYDRVAGTLEITDNSIGMNEDELEEALKVAAHAPRQSGRSKYGMGMKTAACWFGNSWTVVTKKLGDPDELSVHVNVERIAEGNADLEVTKKTADDPTRHYTKISISDLNRSLNTKTIGKIRTFLRSMYREDLRENLVRLVWQTGEVTWDDDRGNWLKAPDGAPYFKEFEFEVEGKKVRGNVAVLETGSRALAGFSIFQNRRMIRGYPDSWRPTVLYGQDLGSNNLINQRLVGEIHLDGFEVSHTKDDIIWDGDEEDELQRKLYHECAEYRRVASDRRKGKDSRKPSSVAQSAAINQLKKELNSEEIVDILTLTDLPAQETLDAAVKDMVEGEALREPTMIAFLGNFVVKVFLADDLSERDYYLSYEAPIDGELHVVVNLGHPYMTQITGSDGFANYLRQCVYDAIAEHKTHIQRKAIHSNTVRFWKDQLLRIPLLIEDDLQDDGDDEIPSDLAVEEAT